MAASRHRRHAPVITAAAVTATVALTTGLTTGCDNVDTAIDCVRTADTIADSVTELQQAVENTTGDPTRVSESLDTIDRDVNKIGDTTDDADVNKAVDDLGTAVDNIRKAIANGDRTPDLGPVTEAAGELTKVCTP
jgi:uncharacterized protein YoxC